MVFIRLNFEVVKKSKFDNFEAYDSLLLRHCKNSTIVWMG